LRKELEKALQENERLKNQTTCSTREQLSKNTTDDSNEVDNCVCVGKLNSTGESNSTRSQQKCKSLYKSIDESCRKHNQSLNETCAQKSNCICVTGKDKNGGGGNNTDRSTNSTDAEDQQKTRQCTDFQK